MAFKLAVLALLFLSCNEPKKEALPLKLLKQKSNSPCLNSNALFHSDTLFIREFKAQDVRMIILCNACERSLETEKKIELYKQAWEAWGDQARRPDWDKLEADLRMSDDLKFFIYGDSAAIDAR